MSKKRRIILVLALGVWAYFLLGGMLGYVVGFQGSAVLYDRWPGFFIGMGVAALALLGILGVMLIAVPILEWVEKGRDEASARNQASGTTVQQYVTAPDASIPTTVREGAEDDVQGNVSRRSRRLVDSGVVHG